jgi:hypothetical protein
MIIHKSKSAIVASKMFKASPRQKEILAAIDSEENLELVQQLDEYLDDEYFAMKQNTETQFTEDTKNTIDNTPDMNDTTDDSIPAPTPSRSHGGSPAKFTPNNNESLMGKHGDELEELENGEPEIGSDEPADIDIPEASTKIKGQPIVADTVVNPFMNLYADLVNVANEIKGFLNSKQDTTGVNRVQIKNDELWIYYNDDINLNNVMTNVINTLNAANYKYFDFNRLARTDNAMVFTVSVERTDTFTGATNEK